MVCEYVYTVVYFRSKILLQVSGSILQQVDKFK